MNLYQITIETSRTFLVDANSHQEALLIGDEVGHMVEDTAYSHAAVELKIVDPQSPDEDVWVGGSHGHWYTLSEYGEQRHL